MTKRKRRSSAPVERRTGAALAELGLDDRQQRVVVWSVTAGGVLAIALVLTLVVNAIGGGQSRPAQASGDVSGEGLPATFQSWPTLKELAPIADRKADTAPLTAKEVFGARALTSGKVTLRRLASRLDQSCAGAVWGVDLTDALAGAGCSQAVRGLYGTADGVYVAQYTLFNLADVAAAESLAKSLASLYRGAWVQPLESARAKFGAYSEGNAYVLGHYLGVTWIGRADGAEPGEKDDFIMLGLAVREAEKAVFRRVVKVAGVPSDPAQPPGPADTAQPSEEPPTDPGASPAVSASTPAQPPATTSSAEPPLDR
ncbi:hypothetical protein SAMN05421833_101458 [Microbispora rosea]|uniref:Uncharacterized protein n=1 Tax=Microbispora rosea TaxID=58117 RepID=A0A1N6RP55_9ACTN|nr:hypothetical protein [Microbispora rosea]GIH45885.1 hypothetical protein Mro03_10640 [Microbispora rosea subsp. rosea]SIQ30581.1 hypothetical protein SAMN05421833_101458 [Microbispora rosea]